MTNNYCGPYAVSHALQIPVPEATRRMREITGKRSIHGVSKELITAVLGVEPVTFERRYTVEQFAADHEGRWIIRIRGHLMMLDGGRIYDNCGTALVEKHWRRRQWVTHAWEVA